MCIRNEINELIMQNDNDLLDDIKKLSIDHQVLCKYTAYFCKVKENENLKK